jgi:hypothetical protein
MNGMNWRDFVDSIREAREPTPFKSKAQQRYKAQRKRNDIYTSPAGHKKLSSGAPFTIKAKRAGTDRLRFEEEVDPASFDTHDRLETRIWEGEDLRPIIKERLMKVAQDFLDRLPVEIDAEDIRLTGSLANYNWSNYSDVDLHIVVDFLGVDENRDLVKAFFDNARMKWNNDHHITMKGYDVEIYVEDSREQHLSSGVYSLLNEEWVKKPKKFRNSIDFPAARHKAEDIEFQVSIVENLITAGKFKTAFKNIDRIKKKIRNMRNAGLESPLREFSIENIAFKILRRNGTLQRLSELKTQIYDDIMTVKEE